jgi:NADH-quinone oxidoreductase subunit J
MLSGSTLLFYLLAALLVGCALIAVTTRQLFRAAIALLFALIGVAGLYFWLSYEFLAAVQIVVYVGGIVVLIIFSIFLTQQTGEKLPSPRVDRLIFAGLAVFCGIALTLLQVLNYDFLQTTNPTPLTVATLGTALLKTGHNGYALPFELVSILLLAAMVGCIVIALKKSDSTPTA